jgi:hypothetical protein
MDLNLAAGRVESIDGQLSVHLALRRQLLDFDRRWPNSALCARFSDARSAFATIGPSSRSDLCAELVDDATFSQSHEPKTALRYAAALAALCAQYLGTIPRQPTTSRRRRSPIHQTYPTAPWIGAAIATYILQKLWLRPTKGSRQRFILDPTCETGELMTEILIEVARRGRFGERIGLVGIDKNEQVLRLARTVLNGAVRRLGLSHALGNPSLVKGDALQELQRMSQPDALASNPPWGLLTDGQDRRLLKCASQSYRFADPYIAITQAALARLRPGGPFGIVLPHQALTAANAKKLRSYLARETLIDYLVELPRSVFPYATMQAVLLLGQRRPLENASKMVSVLSYSMAPRRSAKATLHAERHRQSDLRSPRAWLFGPPGQIAWDRVRQDSVPLEELARLFTGLRPYKVGYGRPPQSAELVANQAYTSGWPKPGTFPVVRGRQIQPYAVLAAIEFLRIGPHLAQPGQHAHFAQSSRIFIREICLRDGRMIAARAPEGVLGRHGVLTVVLSEPWDWILAAVFNSSVGIDYAKSECPGFRRESFGRISVEDLKRFPVPNPLLSSADAIELARVCGQADPQARTAALRRLESLALTIYSS